MSSQEQWIKSSLDSGWKPGQSQGRGGVPLESTQAGLNHLPRTKDSDHPFNVTVRDISVKTSCVVTKYHRLAYENSGKLSQCNLSGCSLMGI